MDEIEAKVIYAGAKDERKPALRLLLEAIQQNPSPPHQKMVMVTEYTAHIALAAKECVPELKALFPSK